MLKRISITSVLLAIAVFFGFRLVAGLFTGSVESLARRGSGLGPILRDSDPLLFWMNELVYLVLGLWLVYISLQLILNHPLFGNGAYNGKLSKKEQDRIIRKRVETYIEEAEAFYEFDHISAAKLSVQKGLSEYPQNTRLIELKSIIDQSEKNDRVDFSHDLVLF